MMTCVDVCPAISGGALSETLVSRTEKRLTHTLCDTRVQSRSVQVYVSQDKPARICCKMEESVRIWPPLVRGDERDW